MYLNKLAYKDVSDIFVGQFFMAYEDVLHLCRPYKIALRQMQPAGCQFKTTGLNNKKDKWEC